MESNKGLLDMNTQAYRLHSVIYTLRDSVLDGELACRSKN